MKRIYKTFILILFTLNVFSQGDGFFHISYSPSIPLGKTGDFTTNMSWRGFGFGFNEFIKSNISVGLDLSWSTYDELLKDQTFEYKELTITGTQNRYFNTVPLHATIITYFGEEDFRFTLGAGIGTSWTEKIMDVGTLSFSDSEWQFSFAPEIGIMYNIADNISPFFKIKYYYSTQNKDFESVSHLNFTLGFMLD